MKKIALLADGWRRYVIYSWVEGIMGGSKELGLDLAIINGHAPELIKVRKISKLPWFKRRK